MHLSSAPLTLAATDLGLFLACRHLHRARRRDRVREAHEAARLPRPFPRAPHPPRPRPREGLHRERSRRAGSPVLDLTESTAPDAVTRTTEAMKAGQPAVAQGALAATAGTAGPTSSRRSKSPAPSAPLVRGLDTKLSRETRGGTILQLTFYSELVGVVQGVPPEFFHVVTPLAESPTASPTSPPTTASSSGASRKRRGATPPPSSSANYPEPVDHCQVCRW